MERSALHEPFLLAECEARVAQGADRIRGIALHRTWGGNNLRLRSRIFRLLHQERRLPLRRMPHQGCRPPEEADGSTRIELAKPDRGGMGGGDRGCPRTSMASSTSHGVTKQNLRNFESACADRPNNGRA